jgi:hypothetical protein
MNSFDITAMNFSHITAPTFTGISETVPGIYAVVVRGIVKWEGRSTREGAMARLNDYIL